VSTEPTALESRVKSAAPEQVRLSLLSGRTQLDVSLPLDVPIAGLAPEMTRVLEAHAPAHSEAREDVSVKEAKDHVWILRRNADTTPLAPNITLREAGVTDGELLRLTAERALSAPTLYDDVVDAAARLNRAGYASWNATAARWMAFVGVHLGSAAWVYFLLADEFASDRAALVGLAVVLALALVGVAVLAHRSHGLPDVGTALGWAVLPIAAAVVLTSLARLGGYGLAAGCVAMVVVAVALSRAIGTGQAGYLAVGVFFGLSGLSLALHTAGIHGDIVGAGLAGVATLSCAAVPRLTARLGRIKTPPPDPTRDAALSTASSSRSEATEPERIDTTAPPVAEDVWARVRSAAATRAGLYVGLAVSAGLGVSAVLLSQIPAHWSGLVFGYGCAAALGFYSQRPGTAVERMALAAPAIAIMVLTCVLAQGGRQPIPLTAFGVTLGAAVVTALIGASGRVGRAPRRLTTVVAYLRYSTTAALIPLALWVIGAYGRLGIQ
jgi:type VII secretion integral membrane protein EccD